MADNRNRRRGIRNRKVKQLLLTLPRLRHPTWPDSFATVGHVDECRGKLAEMLLPGTAQAVIAIEEHKATDDRGIHAHCYLRLRKQFQLPLVELKDTYKEMLGRSGYRSVNVQLCRSMKQTLRYITKEDFNAVLFNVSSDFCHVAFQHYWWARRSNGRMAMQDPHVLRHLNYYRQLEKLSEEINLCPPKDYWEIERPLKRYADLWMLKLQAWFKRSSDRTDEKRKRAVYVWGPPGTGKTTCVEEIIREEYLCKCYYPPTGRFFMGEYKQDFHEFIVMEEFDSKNYPRCMLLRVLEQKHLNREKKHCESKMIRVLASVVLISNLSPEENFASCRTGLRPCAEQPCRCARDDAYLRRIEVIHADTCHWARINQTSITSQDSVTEKGNSHQKSDALQ